MNLRRVEPGFTHERVLTSLMIYPLFTNDFSDFARLGPEWSRFHGRVSEAVATLPGVRAAGVISALPLSGAWESTAFGIEGREPSMQGPSAFFAGVSEGYFDALGIPLIRGRLFDASDRDSAEPSSSAPRSRPSTGPGSIHWARWCECSAPGRSRWSGSWATCTRRTSPPAANRRCICRCLCIRRRT